LVGNGALKGARPLAELKIPPTVQAILASRIDRLPPDEKELLQTLAVVGREFALSLIREVTKQSDDNLKRMLNDLQLGEFIYEQPAVGDIEYVFKHALTQEVAYNSVLTERRRDLHERTGAAVESLFADWLDDHLNELARHYRRSANNEKAAKYLDSAGQQAVQRSAYSEAVEHLSTGLNLLKKLPENRDRDQRELGLQIALARSLTITRGPGSSEVAGALHRARELCGGIGAPTELFTVLYGLVSHHLQRLQLHTAYELGQELLTLAKHGKEPTGVTPVHGRLGMALMMMGDLRAARVHFEDAFPAIDRLARDFSGAFYEANFYPVWGTWALWALGYSDQARQWSRRALAAAEKLSRPAVLANAHGAVAMLHTFLLEHGAALEHAEVDIAIAKEVQLSIIIRKSPLDIS
jgi:tetratricopeptide (TPR) repeat protein